MRLHSCFSLQISVQLSVRVRLGMMVLASTQLIGCVGLVAAGAVGSASVAMDRREVGANFDDKQIEVRANNSLLEHFPQSHINSEVFNRNVLLTGEVPTVAQGQAAARLVGAIPKVREVTNELAVGAPSSLATRAKDTAITAKVKTQLLEDRLLHSGAFVVTTERGNVYLQGRVTHAEAARATELARNVGGVRQVVKVFDYLTDEQFQKLSTH